MSWLRFLFWSKKKNTVAPPSPNIVVRGFIERFATVVPLHVGPNAENAYALILKGETEVIMFRQAILPLFTCACIALLQPGDYVEFEVDHQGFGLMPTLRSSVWNANWNLCTHRVATATPPTPETADPIPEPARPHLTLYTNPNWK